MIIKIPLHQNPGQHIPRLWPLHRQRPHHFRRLLTPKIQLHRLCVSRIVQRDRSIRIILVLPLQRGL